MFRYFISLIYLFCSIIGLLGCSHTVAPANSTVRETPGSSSVASPPCLIYKTREDYSQNIPVILSEDKSAILSYPDVKDIYYKGILAYPTLLYDGFLLDNRGISLNVAFLSLTYKEFSEMTKTPSSSELMKLIIDKDPLKELYQCGKRSQYSDLEKELNDLIVSRKINSCKRLK